MEGVSLPSVVRGREDDGTGETERVREGGADAMGSEGGGLRGLAGDGGGEARTRRETDALVSLAHSHAQVHTRTHTRTRARTCSQANADSCTYAAARGGERCA